MPMIEKKLERWRNAEVSNEQGRDAEMQSFHAVGFKKMLPNIAESNAVNCEGHRVHQKMGLMSPV